jgi:cellulose synthase/poly-beta-1,6-N-acetylglucosamine synthase-like glycosyltransferase
MSALLIYGALYIVQLSIALYLLQPFVLLIFYAIRKRRGILPGRTPVVTPVRNYQFGIIITAHDEIGFIPPILDSLLKQTYPCFNVYVVADACNIGDLHYSDSRIHLLSPLFPLNSQIASLEYGFRHFQDQDEICVIFDPDNLVHPRFLEVMNSWYNAGYLAVQGNLKAKNQEGVYSRIDGLGMRFGSFVDRESRSMFDLSVNIWGCGVSIHRSIYEKITYDEKSLTGGFDKHMQVELALNVPRIAFAAEAVFYDEKVDDGHNFEQQRIRWIAAYFKFLPQAFSVLGAGIKKRDLPLGYFGFNLVRPPYFLLLLSALLMGFIDFFIVPPLAGSWLVVLGIYTLSFFTIISLNDQHRSSAKSMLYIPVLMFHQVRALFRSGAGRKSLLKTRHSKIMYIEELLENSSLEV